MKQNRVLVYLVALLLAVSVLPVPFAVAFTVPKPTVPVPPTLSYQGTMYNTDGTPFTGVKKITFSLYGVMTGGTALWTETQNAVNIVNGRFATVLTMDPMTKVLANKSAAWIGIKVDPETSEMTPRQPLTSVPFAHKADNGVPIGGIIMWGGKVLDIPTGWALCNGQTVTIGSVIYTTPDLRDRFILGSGSDTTNTDNNPKLYAPWTTGGADKHTLSISEMPSHNHAKPSHRMLYYNGTGTVISTDNSGSEPNLYNSGSDPDSNGGGAAHNNMPPYFALAYIMRIQ